MIPKFERIGIIGAMDCEIDSIVELLGFAEINNYAGMHFFSGTFEDLFVCVVKCGVGKVNAAMCAQALIDRYNCDVLINTGIAGAIDDDLKVGDVIISMEAVEHDFNATGVGYPQGEIPGQDVCRYMANPLLGNIMKYTCRSVLDKGSAYFGTIASGDIFVSEAKTKKFIHDKFNAKCCEMEGAAIAHVAYKNGIPFQIVRAISDSASDDAAELYDNFEEYAAKISKSIIQSTLEVLCELLTAF